MARNTGEAKLSTCDDAIILVPSSNWMVTSSHASDMKESLRV
eukprot:CAMPEP_0198579378 /NCGR_PEP_ID=MMETSP1462-20131121/121478_1 /TAXON_ID=1333877 /ORGANISM="Brandtodinium nutriculum, Strain RCC3387" /LENGTH=41 /DNA_ID= /DNA_START= /DNA_END= /DNA_ORIENTATION=